jgi:hypothetical protein
MAPGWFGRYYADALQKLSLTDATASVPLMTDCVEIAGEWSGTPAVLATAANVGGCLIPPASGAAALSQTQVAVSTLDWYVVTRMKYGDAAGVAKYYEAGLVSSGAFASGVQFGALGTNFTGGSGTHYTCRSSSDTFATVNSQASTIGLDTAYHVFRAWLRSGALWFAVDNETPISISATKVPATTQWYANFCCTNGERALCPIDKFMVVTPLAV